MLSPNSSTTGFPAQVTAPLSSFSGKQQSAGQRGVELPTDVYTSSKACSSAKGAKSTGTTIKFQGSQTTELAKNYLLSDKQLQMALEKEKEPHYGQLPEVISNAFSQKEKDIQKLLNRLAGELHIHRLTKGETKQIGLKDSTMKVEYMGEGQHAVVYKLTAGASQPFALKVFRPGTAGTGIPYKEVANGAFMTGQEVKNASKLYMANPSNNWALMEYVPSDATLESRIGQNMEAKHIAITDADGKNSINGILIDHGGTLTAPNEHVLDAESFNAVLKEIKPEKLLKRLFR